MTTRCRPGQLAIVARNTSPIGCFDHFLGVPITVTVVNGRWGMWAWSYAGPRMHCPNCGTGISRFLDADLDPINGPKQPEGTHLAQPIREATHA